MKGHYDFSRATRGAVVKTNKERITIRLDLDITQWFREQVKSGGDYQSLINDALRTHIQHHSDTLETTLRRVLREELKRAG